MTDWRRNTVFPALAHQVVGVNALLANPAFALFDSVGAGKTKQVVDAACEMFRRRWIDAVVTVAPGAVRSVWADPDPVLGEVAKHAWATVALHEYHSRTPKLPPQPAVPLPWIVTNYEFLRRPERLAPLIAWAQRRNVLLVLDESWMIKNPRAQQTKAILKLRAACARVVVLNGTPGDPGEVFSQFQALNPAILGHRNFFSFRAKYARMGGFKNKQIVEWVNLDEFQRRIAPYALRRTTHDCFTLPPVSHTQIEARLTPETWRHYRAMRDDLITWLSQNEASTAAQAGVRVMRLAQITAGLLGGVEAQADLLDEAPAGPPQPVREIGREKLDALIEWLQTHWDQTKLVVFTHFRVDVERAALCLQAVYPSVRISKLYGGQSPEERAEAKRLLAPGGDPAPAIVVGNAASGGAGLNFAAANLCVYLGSSFSLKDRLQSMGRVDRPGQTRPVTYLDILATGPNGERTIDHTTAAALRRKQDISELTASAWREELLKEAA